MLCLLFVGCQATPQQADPPLAPVPAMPEAPAYRIDPAASELRVLVYRDGPLSAFGHDHVLVAPAAGVVHAGESAAQSGFHVIVNVADFDVDPAAARAEEGEAFSGNVSASAREGTRRNLLGEHVLDAKRHPRLVIESVALDGPRWNPTVRARVTLRGVERNIAFPAAVFEGGDALTVIANFSIRQSDFGMEPFSVLGGGLKVRDALDVRVRIVARASPDAASD